MSDLPDKIVLYVLYTVRTVLRPFGDSVFLSRDSRRSSRVNAASIPDQRVRGLPHSGLQMLAERSIMVLHCVKQFMALVLRIDERDVQQHCLPERRWIAVRGQ